MGGVVPLPKVRSKNKIKDLLVVLDLPVTEDTVEHLQTLVQAMDLYVERSESYGQVWKQYGALANLLNTTRKCDRLMESWWFMEDDQSPAMHKESLDDAVDIINYDSFFIRCARDGNIVGERPDRPLVHPSAANVLDFPPLRPADG